MTNFSHYFLSVTLSLLLLLLLQLSITLALTNSINANGKQLAAENNQREFDYFKLALQWPATYCRGTTKCCSKNACCKRSNSPAEFTIHGLWPEYNNGGWPSCCRKSNFNEREISTLLGGLEKYWPTLSCGSPSTCHGTKGTFWGHEWEKHGTCSYPVLKDEYNYFLAGLNLYLKYNLTTVFNEAGYLPSNTEKYPRGGIVSAIENAFHLTPSLKCSKGALVELYLCFYKDFQPRDCGPDYVTQNGKYSSKSSCPKYVSLPEFMMPGLNDIETEGVMEF